MNVCFTILKDEDTDPVFAHLAFENIELTVLALNQRFASFLPQFLPEIFDIFTKLESQDAFDGYMLHHLSILKILFACIYVDPAVTVQFILSKGFLVDFTSCGLSTAPTFKVCTVANCKF